MLRALLLGALLTASASSHATVYTYQGKSFSDFGNAGSFPDAQNPWMAGGAIFFSFVTDTPIAANSTFSTRPVNWYYYDGVDTMTPGSPRIGTAQPYFPSFLVKTDASGNISNWFIGVQFDATNGEDPVHQLFMQGLTFNEPRVFGDWRTGGGSSAATRYYTQGVYFGAPNVYYSANNALVGTWQVTQGNVPMTWQEAMAPVPEPAEWALLAAGLALVSSVGTRRKPGFA